MQFITEDNNIEPLIIKNTQNTLRSERSYIVSLFLDEINKERINTKFKKMTARTIAVKLSHLNKQDLYYFLSVCKDAKNRRGSFSRCFFGSLKVK